MSYFEDYIFLKNSFSSIKDNIVIPSKNLQIFKIPFTSDNINLQGYDNEITENENFHYYIFRNSNVNKSNGVILMLHGLNEKSWDKYLTWAEALLRKTRKSVILFPISFHMDRAPLLWSAARMMKIISNRRIENNIHNAESSFLNASISDRLHNKPDRIFWSGARTINDIVKLVQQIKSGIINYVNKDTIVDVFGYSIGAFITQVLLISNPFNYFTNSKFVLFCGGSTFNKMYPVSKFIMDSDAYQSVSKFYTDGFEKNVKEDEKIKMYYSESTKICSSFKSMLKLEKMSEYRENKFKQFSNKIISISLYKDKVMPWFEIKNTLKGLKNDIPIETNVLDFNYEYDHENPFPLRSNIEDEVNKGFNTVFELAGDFLG